MLAVLKLLLLTYWLVTNSKSVALVLITVLSDSLCGLLQLESKKQFKDIWKSTFQTLFCIPLCFYRCSLARVDQLMVTSVRCQITIDLGIFGVSSIIEHVH